MLSLFDKEIILLSALREIVLQTSIFEEEIVLPGITNPFNFIFPSNSLTEANTILSSMETTVESQDGPIQDTITKINQGLNELNSCDLTKTDPKNLKNFRELIRNQKENLVTPSTNNLITAKNSLRQDLNSLIQLAEDNLVSP